MVFRTRSAAQGMQFHVLSARSYLQEGEIIVRDEGGGAWRLADLFESGAAVPSVRGTAESAASMADRWPLGRRRPISGRRGAERR